MRGSVPAPKVRELIATPGKASRGHDVRTKYVLNRLYQGVKAIIVHRWVVSIKLAILFVLSDTKGRRRDRRGPDEADVGPSSGEAYN